MKRAFYGLVVVLAFLFGGVASWLWFSHGGLIPPNFNSPAPAPTPCIQPLLSSDNSETVCHDKCGLDVRGRSIDNATRVVCCPHGFTPDTDHGNNICKKDP
jgi:hypothetical protein